MAKLNPAIEVNVKDVELVKNLMELLSDNIDCINEPLTTRLKELSENNEFGWVCWGDLRDHIDDKNCEVFLNGVEQFYVTGYNKLLRKVNVYNNDTKRIDTVNADSFLIRNVGCDSFAEWGL
jgi:hypothetical protein